MKELVSVIVPVYNASATLERCIQSICMQTYDSFELILVDDASTDCSAEICALSAQRDDRVRFFCCNENKGPSYARNTGLKQAKGKWVTFADADDTPLVDWLQRLKKLWSPGSLPMVGIGTGKEEKTKPVQIFAQKDFLKLYQTAGCFHSCTNKLYEAAILKKRCIHFDESCRNGEDLLFNLDYLKWINQIVYDPQILYDYSIRENSLHAANGKERFESVRKMDCALNTAVKEFGMGSDQWIIDGKMLQEYLYTVMLYTQNLEISWAQKVKLVKGLLKDKRVRQLFSEINTASASKYYKFVLSSKSAGLICLYGILCAKRKRRKKI